MSSRSQASYASRLSKGKKLYQFIITFPGYAPDVEECRSEPFKTLLDNMDITQVQYTETRHAFAEVAKQRKKLFVAEPDSLSKRITLMNSYIRGKFQRESQIYADVNTLVKKIRGDKPVKIVRETETEILSRSERSYGSQAEYLADLITLAAQLGAGYAPINSLIKLEKLQELHAKMLDLNNEAAAKLAIFKPFIIERQNNFEQLAETAARIKEMVRVQYGVDAIEYKLVKGISF